MIVDIEANCQPSALLTDEEGPSAELMVSFLTLMGLSGCWTYHWDGRVKVILAAEMCPETVRAAKLALECAQFDVEPCYRRKL